jgi:hypothetical protein
MLTAHVAAMHGMLVLMLAAPCLASCLARLAVAVVAAAALANGGLFCISARSYPADTALACRLLLEMPHQLSTRPYSPQLVQVTLGPPILFWTPQCVIRFPIFWSGRVAVQLGFGGMTAGWLSSLALSSGGSCHIGDHPVVS